MNKILTLIASLMLVCMTSCTETNNPDKGDPKIGIETEVTEADGKVEVVATFTCNVKEMDYAYGIAKVEDVEAAESLIVFVTEQIAEGKATTQNKFPGIALFEIEKLAKYIVYAVPVKNKGVNGEISTSDTIQVFSSYIGYEPVILATPAAISDNGNYVVGNNISMENSFIYDMTAYKDAILDEVVLYDISDNGSVSVGTDKNNKACIMQDGEITVLQTTGTGTMWAVSPDGSKAVGEIAGDAVVYENGTVSKLSLEGATGTDGCAIVSAIAKQIGTNGVIAGIVVDDASAPLHAYWDVEGRLHVIGEGKNTINVEREINFMYGGWANEEYIRMSPNGKYISGTVYDAEGLKTLLYPYILDTETGDVHVANISEFEQYNDYSNMINEIHPRVEAVTNEGEVLFSVSAAMGVSEYPYVYTKDGGVDKLETYLEDKFGKDIEPAMKGAPCGISADGKTLVLTHSNDSGFITDIYIF